MTDKQILADLTARWSGAPLPDDLRQPMIEAYRLGLEAGKAQERKRCVGVPDTALADIVKDLKKRRGLRQEWESIDVDIRNEIAAEWRGFIARAIEQEG